MGNLIIDYEKEYRVHYRVSHLTRVRMNIWETLEEAENDYIDKKKDKDVSYVELLECKPIKAFQK